MHKPPLHSDLFERIFHLVFAMNEHVNKQQYDDDVVNREQDQQEMMIPKELIPLLFQVHLNGLQYLLLHLVHEYLLVITKLFDRRLN